jgi:hypothetical protein
MKRSVKALIAMTGATALAVSAVGIAAADTLTNNVGGAGQIVTVAPGSTTLVAFRVNATATPAGDPAGCDAGGGSDKATITVSSTTGYTNLKLKGQGAATAGSVSFDAVNCKQSKKFQFIVAAGTPGGTSWSIHAAATDGIAGSTYTNSGDFTLRVSATAAATSLVLSPATTSFSYGTATKTWTATLTTASGGLPVSGKTIDFNAGGITGTAVTNASGVATFVATIGTALNADPVAYDVDAAWPGDSSYASSSDSGTFTVTKADQAAMAITSPTSGGFGQTLPISYSGGSGTGAVTFGASGACALAASGTDVTITSGSGTCTVTGGKAADTNYNAVTATPSSFSVGQASQTALAIDSPNAGTYGQLLDITTTGGSGTGAVTYDAGSSTACAIESGKLRISSGTGTCAITATKAADSNYSATTSPSHTVTVGKAAPTLSVTGPDTGTYGESYDITYTSSAAGGSVTFGAGSSTACEVVGNQVHITHGTGSCAITATRAADSNYSSVTSAAHSVVPDKATATISLSDLTAVYDGSGHAATATTDPSGLSTITITYDGSSTLPVDAGEYAVVASLTSDDYAADDATDTLVISPKTLTGHITADNKEYDGTTDAVVHAVTLTGVVGSDDVSLQVDPGSFASADAGNGITVTAGVSLSGGDSANYALSSDTASTTANILKRTVTGSITADDKTYDGNTSASASPADPALDRVVGDDDVHLVVDSASFDGEDAGPHTVTANLSLAGDDAANYELTSSTATASADIDPKGLSASITADDKTYDGSDAATVHPTLGSGVVSPDEVSINVLSATFDDAAAGEGRTVTAVLELQGGDAANYTLTGAPFQALADIDPLGITGSFTADNKVYDGGTAATVLTKALHDPITGDDVELSLTAAFADENVGNGKTVSAVSPSLTGDDAANYTLGSVSSTTANITAKTLTGTITASNKTYDGVDSATVTAVNPVSGIVGTDAVTLTASNGHFADQNVGTGKTVTADVALTGDDAGNYALSSSTATTTANITAAVLTVTAPSFALHPGDAVPTLTPTITGFVSGEGAWNLTTQPTCSTTYTASSPVGVSYPVTCSGLFAQNYTASYTAGAITLSYVWTGFYQPIDAAPNNSNGKDSSVIAGTVFNKAKAGSSIPVKFSLGGNQGLSIFATNSPSVTPVSCSTAAVVDALEEVGTATTSGLKYDATAGQYIYTWKTATSWANTCQRLTVKTADGAPHYAFFTFTK